MLEQLKELLDMQKALDKDILEKHGIKEYPLENMRIALFVELGELMNELPTKFKHWKSSAVDNREKALVEYVDCLHFALSLTNNLQSISKEYYLTVDHNYFGEDLQETAYIHSIYDLLEMVAETSTLKLYYLLALGIKLGFEWDEIYSAYIEKNKINYERLKNGY